MKPAVLNVCDSDQIGNVQNGFEVFCVDFGYIQNTLLIIETSAKSERRFD